MPATEFSSLIIPEVFSPYSQLMALERNRLVASGAMVVNPRLQSWLSQAEGNLIHLPFYLQLDRQEARVGTDNPADILVLADHGAIRTKQEFAIKQVRNMSWKSMDILPLINGRGPTASNDPMRVIAEMVGDYWADQYQKNAIAMLKGIYEDNLAANAGDMVYDVSHPTPSTAPTAANLISSAVVNQTKLTMGDRSDDLVLMFCHSVVKASLAQQGLIDYVTLKNQNLRVPTFLDMIVIEDDSMPAVADGTYVSGGATLNRFKFTTFFLGTGALAFAQGTNKNATETYRDPRGGNGEGSEELYSRQHYAMHVPGISFDTANGVFPTINGRVAKFANNAMLEAATTWDRVVQGPALTTGGSLTSGRKFIKLAFCVTNG